MKLNTAAMRYLTPDDFRVLTAAEMGSKNHEVVPTKLITQIAKLKSVSATNRSISDLAKAGLIARVKNAKYDGYRLTYGGYDYLALKAFIKRDTVFSVGAQIGIGKESDIVAVSDDKGTSRVLKIHRLGRISFRTVKNNRDYLKNRSSASWMYLSRLAAQKEFAFMKALHDEGFEVPTPIDQSRHQIVMSLIDGFPMRQLQEHDDPARLYQTLMDFIVRLAQHGLIHCDFNEFNIMIRENFDRKDPKSEIVVIDFPQCVSIDHVDARRYFERDVECIKLFFKKKLGYVSKTWPDFDRDVKRNGEAIDKLVGASGFSKKQSKDLEAALAQSLEVDENDVDDQIREDEEENEQLAEDAEMIEDAEQEEHDEEEEEDDEEDEEEEELEEEEEEDPLEKAIAERGIENLKMDKLGNYILD
ncbi:Serine/threonine-protein kinase rio2 [Yarrowia sp. C11]|nr:Serine/threonine-protein kinase rio2 [Yarrowia sp. E02]KAG5371294.1 Serine/threonine-protein kinase rio2 [Yarrowia sp. C11]